jgi:GNAT superfamily N-acetyltransferase
MPKSIEFFNGLLGVVLQGTAERKGGLVNDAKGQVVEIVQAEQGEAKTVSSLVVALLHELAPEAREQVGRIDFASIASKLLRDSKIIAFVAYVNGDPVGLVTLNECASIYAGGIFGEISEFYVLPAYRSCGIGRQLLAVVESEAGKRNWRRVEVGAPDKEKWSKTFSFYTRHGFLEIGPRLKKIVLNCGRVPRQ